MLNSFLSLTVTASEREKMSFKIFLPIFTANWQQFVFDSGFLSECS